MKQYKVYFKKELLSIFDKEQDAKDYIKQIGKGRIKLFLTCDNCIGTELYKMTPDDVGFNVCDFMCGCGIAYDKDGQEVDLSIKDEVR